LIFFVYPNPRGSEENQFTMIHPKIHQGKLIENQKVIKPPFRGFGGNCLRGQKGVKKD
jgi:hypothetical protein